ATTARDRAAQRKELRLVLGQWEDFAAQLRRGLDQADFPKRRAIICCWVQALQSDAIPEVPDQPQTQPGDLWLLGSHRLRCGDSSQADELGYRAGQATVSGPGEARHRSKRVAPAGSR